MYIIVAGLVIKVSKLYRDVYVTSVRGKAALLVHETMRVKQLSLELTGL